MFRAELFRREEWTKFLGRVFFKKRGRGRKEGRIDERRLKERKRDPLRKRWFQYYLFGRE